jgi:hypothetical protein
MAARATKVMLNAEQIGQAIMEYIGRRDMMDDGPCHVCLSATEQFGIMAEVHIGPKEECLECPEEG